MMFGIWSYSDGDIVSSFDESSDSDKIDSDIEAELYGIVHHQEILTPPDNSLIEDTSSSKECEEKLVIQEDTCSQNSVSSANNQCINSSSSFRNNSADNYDKTCATKAHSTPKINISCLSVKRKSESLSENSNDISVNLTSEGKQCNNNVSNKKLKTQEQNKEKELYEKFVSGTITSESDDSVIWEPHYSSRDVNSNGISNKKLGQLPKNKMFHKEFLDRTIILESNDSDDSVIWSEPGEESRDIKTNVLGDTMSLDSSSDSSFTSELRQHTSNSAERKNMSLPNIKLIGNSTDPWYINTEDLFRSKRYSGRYHEKAALNCNTCKQRGHTSKSCSIARAVKCFICGGNHLGAACENRVCSKCYCTGHGSRRCWMQTTSACFICRMKGHSAQLCPERWRRFHLTTNPGEFVEGKQLVQDTPIYCFNCGCEGHFGAECMEPRMYSTSFPTWPSVIYYRDPTEMYQNLKENINAEYSQGQNLSQGEMSNKTLKKRRQRKKRAEMKRMLKQKKENERMNAVKRDLGNGERNMEETFPSGYMKNTAKLQKRKINESVNFTRTVDVTNPRNFKCNMHIEQFNFPRTQKTSPAINNIVCSELNEIKNIWKFKRYCRRNKKSGKAQNNK